MTKTITPAPGFSRSGKCPRFLLALNNVNMLSAMMLKPYVNKSTNSTLKKSELGSIVYILNPDDGQFLQVCGENGNSIVNFRLQVRRKNEKHYTTLVFTGEVGRVREFSKKHNLLFFK